MSIGSRSKQGAKERKDLTPNALQDTLCSGSSGHFFGETKSLSGRRKDRYKGIERGWSTQGRITTDFLMEVFGRELNYDRLPRTGDNLIGGRTRMAQGTKVQVWYNGTMVQVQGPYDSLFHVSSSIFR